MDAVPLTIRRARLDTLHEDPRNARTHDARNLAAITASLQQFGQVEPLVVQAGTGLVIGGHGRLQAMRALGWVEADIVEVAVGEQDAIRLGLALNRTAELAGWDYENLGTLLRELQKAGSDLDTLGWAAYEAGPLLAADWAPPAVEPLTAHVREPSVPAIELTAEERTLFLQAKALLEAAGQAALTEGGTVAAMARQVLARG